MNMKKTFAGAMAGALAVSAMATSASASIPGPGEYTVDLTKDAEFYATVQFTFDADYMIDANAKSLDINFKDTSGLFDISNMTDLTVDVLGSTGVKTQTLKYNSTWNDVNFYNWNLFDWAASASAGTFSVPVSYAGVANDKQTLFLDKYNTVKEALAVKMSDGNKKYPVLFDAATKTWTADNGTLDFPYFDKIVVTARIPASAKKDLNDLNGVGGYKTKLTASIKGVHDIEIYELANDTTAEGAAVAAAEADVAAAEADVEAAKAELAALKEDKAAATEYDAAVKALGDLVDAGAPTPATSVTLTAGTLTTDGKTAIEIQTLAGKTYAVNGTNSEEYDAATDADAVKAYNDEVAKLDAYNAKKAAYEKTIADYDGKTVAEIEAAIDLAEDAVTNAQDALAAAKEALKEAQAAAKEAEFTLVGVDVAKADVINGETLFTKFESNKVGLKTGVVVDGGTVKTLSGDLGVWKPDALRQIADAIADNEGVTLTFTAKDNFDDAAYRAWFSAVDKYGINGTLNNVLYGNNKIGTDNDKDAYEVWGVSMFTGAIVLNRDFSKQFSQSGLVDWGTNTITFDWDELTEGRFYDASIVLHSMELLSTQNVEWVSCTVTVPEQGAVEEVDPSQGAEDNSTEIDDTPVETEAPEVITEAPATEAAPETEAPAPVAPVTNPTTGNAPVALAVIPVALAAAAIVAKKRG